MRACTTTAYDAAGTCTTLRSWLRHVSCAPSVNPLRGHRSILSNSDLGALLPCFLVVIVTVGSPFFACMQLRDKRPVEALKRPSFCRKSCRFDYPKLRFPSSPRPTVELCAGLVLVSGLPSWEWTVCQRSIPATFDLRGLCLAGEAWKFVRDLENLRCNAGSNTLCGFGAMYAFFPDWWYAGCK